MCPSTVRWKLTDILDTGFNGYRYFFSEFLLEQGGCNVRDDIPGPGKSTPDEEGPPVEEEQHIPVGVDGEASKENSCNPGNRLKTELSIPNGGDTLM